MKAGTRIIFSTAVLYGKLIITALLSFVSVPIVLRALGESDYGLYNLVAGIITMLAFLNTSMVGATQRFLSVAIGGGNIDNLNKVFTSSIVLHGILGIIIVIFFEGASLFLFNEFLTIEPDRLNAAKNIYQFLVISTFFTVISVPYESINYSMENMVTISLVEIVEAVGKLILAFCLLSCKTDRLVVYGFFISAMEFAKFIAYRIYDRFKYSNLRLSLSNYLDWRCVGEMAGYSGWNTLWTLASIGRNQGISIVLNNFGGTRINASYGLANQVNGILSRFNVTFQKAVLPQMMQSEGMSERQRVIQLGTLNSKYSILIFSAMAVPVFIEMPYLLNLWLGAIPQYAVGFCRCLVLFNLVQQYGTGIFAEIFSVGRIRQFTMVSGLLAIMNLPVVYLLLRQNVSMSVCLISMTLFEILTLIVSLRIAKKEVGINIAAYFREVVLSTLPSISLPAALAIFCHLVMSQGLLRFAVLVLVFESTLFAISWMFALNQDERQYIKNIASNICKKTQSSGMIPR